MNSNYERLIRIGFAAVLNVFCPENPIQSCGQCSMSRYSVHPATIILSLLQLMKLTLILAGYVIFSLRTAAPSPTQTYLFFPLLTVIHQYLVDAAKQMVRQLPDFVPESLLY